MAIANADGSIVLSTKVDVSGTRQGFKQIVNSARRAGNQTKSALEPLTAIIQKQEKRLEYLNNAYAELIVNGRKNTTQAKRLRDEIDALSKEMKDNQAVASAMGTKGATAIQKMSSALKVAVGYFIGIQTIMSAIGFSKEASSLATEQEASVQRLIDIYGTASKEVGDFIDLNARALGMSKTAAAGFSAVYGNLFSVWADQATNAELTNQYLNMTAVIASKTGRTVEDVQERIRSGLLGNTEAIEDLGVFVNVKTIEMTDAFQRMADGKSWQQLDAYTQQQIRTMAILEQSTAKYGNQVAETSALTRSQFRSAYEDFQATWGQIVNTVLMPVLQIATEILNVFTLGLRALFNLSGGILGDMANTTEDISSNIQSSVGSQEDLTEETEDTNKAMNGYTASFDELNTIQKDNQGSKKKGGGTTAGLGNALGITKNDSKNAKKIGSEISKTLISIMGVVGIALVAVGLILCATGNLAWGIGFIVAGAGLLGVTMATLKSNAISQEVKDSLSNVLIITGIVAIILGILCCIAQQWVVGIGLIVMGAISIGTTVALNWQGIKEKMQGVFGGILAMVGIVAIIIGVLCCTAQMWGIGIGLIVTGALSVGSVVAVNFDIIKEMIQGKLGTALAIVGIVAIVLGVLCCLTGNWALGLGLIVSGVTAVGGVTALNWDSILDKLKDIWSKIQAWWNANVKQYFTYAWWASLGKNMINGLLRWIVNGLNKLIDKLNNFGFALPNVLGGGRVGFDIKKLDVPQLAKGAVLPPNKPFLAMVGDQKSGTNVEAPLDTIVDAMRIALGGSNGFSGKIEVPIYLDSRQIAIAVREAEDNFGSQTVFGGFANAY